MVVWLPSLFSCDPGDDDDDDDDDNDGHNKGDDADSCTPGLRTTRSSCGSPKRATSAPTMPGYGTTSPRK